MPQNAPSSPTYRFDRGAAFIATATLILIPVILVIRDEPIRSPGYYFVLRLVLGLSASLLGAAIPGFLNVDWSGRGLIVRIGGALALFSLAYLWTPGALADQNGGHASFSQAKAADAVLVFLSSIGFIASIFPILLTALMLWLKARKSSHVTISVDGQHINITSASADEIRRVMDEIREKK